MSRLISAARASFVLGASGALLAIAVSILLARSLGPELYAKYALLLSVLAWLLILGEAGCNAGLQRFFAEAATLKARRTLYTTLQVRRWGLILLMSGIAIAVGPIWASRNTLATDQWGPWTFAGLGLLAGATLHAQLATSSLLASFAHQRALAVANCMTVLRALALGAVCLFSAEPVSLVLALLAVACLEAVILHWTAVNEFRDERGSSVSRLANAAQRHGLVGVADKASTAITGPPLLLLVLAASHAPAELAMFALASDVLQKLLGIVNLPISNLVSPALNESRNYRDRFLLQIARFGGVVAVVNTLAVGALAAAIPVGLPLIFGASYAQAVPIALIWLVPLFFEASVRMIWGSSLLTHDHYRWIVAYNAIFASVGLLVLYLIANTNLLFVVATMAILRAVMAAGVLLRAAQLELVPLQLGSLRIVLATCGALAFSLLLQFAMAGAPDIWILVVGLATYAAVIAVTLHLVPLIPGPTHEAIRAVVGRHEALFMRAVPHYWSPEKQ